MRIHVSCLLSVFLGLMLWPTVAPAIAHAQEVFASTGSGAPDGATKATAMATFANERLNKLEVCGGEGRLYGPGHDRAAAGGCVQDFQISGTGGGIFHRVARFMSGIRLALDASESACGASSEGHLVYNSATKRLELCNGTSWVVAGGFVDGMVDYNDCTHINSTSSDCAHDDYKVVHTNCAAGAVCSVTPPSVSKTGRWFFSATGSPSSFICCRYLNHP